MRVQVMGRPIRLVFQRQPHPRTKKEARQHRWTRVTIAEEHEDHTHLLARAEVKAHPPDKFTREGGRMAALMKALGTGLNEGRLTCSEAGQIFAAYLNRPRSKTPPLARMSRMSRA